MCGIAGMHRRGDRQVPKLGRLTDALLLAIEYRGRDATGMLTMLPNGKVQVQRTVTPARRFVQKRKAIRNEVRTVLLHTRFATVGDPDDVRNAHPQINGHCAAVHNGTIYNHRELFDAFGMKRHAEVDSEVIPALLTFAGWENAADAIDLFDGGAAFAAVSDEHPDEVILARTEGYPLAVYATPDFIVWASTREVIESAWMMTFGRRPEGGEWIKVPEWTMLRVNGTIEVTTIRKPLPKPKPSKKAKRRKVGTRSSMSTYVPPIYPVREAQRALDLAVKIKPAHQDREPWMEEAVRDLMRIEGYSYAEAFDAVYGVEPDDGDDWLDDLLADERWSL